MPFLRADWCRPWNRVVTVSDASEEGFGVCATKLPAEAVSSIGRVSERDRFRRCSGHSARESALTSAGFVKDDLTGKWAEGMLDDEEYLHLSGWDLEPNFPEVSRDHLHEDSWSVVRQGPWRKHEHIVHLEARALVKSFEFVVQDQQICNSRQLFLVDSMSAALAFDRCRSKNHRMLRQIRKFCSLGLARNISFSVRWVPSELNPADAPSRDRSSVIQSAPHWRSHEPRVRAEECSFSAAAKEKPEQIEEICWRDHGSLEHGDVFVRAEGHWGASREVLQAGVPCPGQVCQQPEPLLEDTYGIGFMPEQVLQSPFSAGPAGPPWGQDPGHRNASPSSVWKTRVSEASGKPSRCRFGRLSAARCRGGAFYRWLYSP